MIVECNFYDNEQRCIELQIVGIYVKYEPAKLTEDPDTSEPGVKEDFLIDEVYHRGGSIFDLMSDSIVESIAYLICERLTTDRVDPRTRHINIGDL